MRGAFLICCLLAVGLAPPGRAVSAGNVVLQTLFLGDRTCGDNVRDCAFADVVAQHRYLHLVIHDQPLTQEWQLQIWPVCSDSMPTVRGGETIAADGYLEIVVDLEAPTVALQGKPACYVLRGRRGWSNTYYSAYFDDTPTPDADVLYPGYRSMAGRPYLPDLDVTEIQRFPRYAYDGNPRAPEPGQTVTFVARVSNVGAVAVPSYSYRWTLDGKIVGSGQAGALAPGTSVQLSLSRTWDGEPDALTFATDPQVPEISTSNDSLSIRTDALALGFWVEKSAYSYFLDHQWAYCAPLACAGSDSFEDWLQRQVSAWNAALGKAVYPGYAPAGIADRVRVDEIVVVPDGSLPLHGGLPTNNPDSSDHTVDLQWGMPARSVADVYDLDGEGQFDLDWGTIHELNHARYLGDLYRFDLPLGHGNVVDVTDAHGRPLFDPAHPYDPANQLHIVPNWTNQPFLYLDREQDLMTCPCNAFYSRYSALTWNRIRGRRARCGNANPPCNLGEWFLEFPPVNRLRVVDPSGHPFPNGSSIRLLFDSGTGYASHAYHDADNLTLPVRNGEVTLPSDPFRARGSARQQGHNLLLLDLRSGTREWFCFEEPTDFNLAYWLGYRDRSHPAIFTLHAGATVGNGCDTQLPAELVNEPFATSPGASRISARAAGHGYQVRIQLRDGGPGDLPMRNRQLRLLGPTGRLLSSGITGSDGVSRMKLSRLPARIVVDDATDNHLTLAVSPSARPRAPVQLP